jgi:hypothetical protein
MKVSELTGAQLDYWVARALGDRLVRLLRADGDRIRADRCETRFGEQWDWSYFAPSRAWMDGGPIIERDQIFLQPPRDVHYNGGPNAGWKRYDQWTATVSARTRTYRNPNKDAADLFPGCVGRGAGETPLIAAMRAKVASHYGEEVPDAE